MKIKYLDASALVKLYVNEEGSQQLREYFYSVTHNFYTTWLCLAEALGVLKRKWNRNEIETGEYLKAASSLIINWRNRIESDDIKSVDPPVPLKVKKMAEKYNIDYSDALQLWIIKNGRYKGLVAQFETNVYKSALFLITGDGDLANAAFSEGIEAWNCTKGNPPNWAY